MSRRHGSLSLLFTWRTALTEPESSASSTERHVGLTLSLFMSEAGDSAFPGVETLAERCDRSASTVREALRGLERKGWLSIDYRRGRGHTNLYTTTFPDEGNRLSPVVSDPDGPPSQTPPESADSPSRETPQSGPADPSSNPETHLSPVGFAGEKTTGASVENHRESLVKPPVSGPNHVRTTSIPRQQQQEPLDLGVVVDAAAAAELRMTLSRLNVTRSIRQAALADPARARAWLELAMREARSNVAGFFVAGFETGEWPSGRGAATVVVPEIDRRSRQLRAYMTTGGCDADEARHMIDVEWSTLTQVERSELHLLLDELISDRLPELEQPARVGRSVA